jgi:hypothetical protein
VNKAYNHDRKAKNMSKLPCDLCESLATFAVKIPPVKEPFFYTLLYMGKKISKKSKKSL